MHVEAGELNHSVGGGLVTTEEQHEVPPLTLLIIDDTVETDTGEVGLKPHEMLVIDALLAVRKNKDGWCSRSDIYDTGFLEGEDEGVRNRRSKQARERVAMVTYGEPPRSIIEDNGKERGGMRVRIVPELQIIDARDTEEGLELGEVIALALAAAKPELTELDDATAALLEEAADAAAREDDADDQEKSDDTQSEQDTTGSANPEQHPDLFVDLARTAQVLIYAEASKARRRPLDTVMYKPRKKQAVVTPRRAKVTKESRDEPESSTRQARAGGYVPKSEDSIAMYMADIGKHPLLTKEGEVYMAQTIEAGKAAREVIADPGFTDLPPEQRVKLRRIAQLGARTETEFTQSNLRLAVAIAKKYQASGMPLLDLIQEGNLGLMHAVEKFDWRKGFKFSTYATWWIKQAITRGIANTGRTIRLPVHAVDSLSRLTKTRIRLETQLGRRPRLEELASDMGISVKKVTEILEHAADAISLNQPVTSAKKDAAELGDLVEDKNAEDPAVLAVSATLPAIVARALSGLDQRERAILELRFGLEDDKPRTLEEVGQEFNLTRERIRQIEARAMSKVRHPSSGGSLRAAARD